MSAESEPSSRTRSSRPRPGRSWAYGLLVAALATATVTIPGVADAAVPAPSAPVTFPYTGSAVPIPDSPDLTGDDPGAPAVAPLEVTGMPGVVSKVVLSIDGSACSSDPHSTTVGIDHSFISDLRITLTAPDGRSVVVIRNVGGGGHNFCDTVLDDDATASIQSVTSGQAPFSGTFRPANPLSALDGAAANGEWTLTAQDYVIQDTGHIRAFSLIIQTVPPTSLSATMTVAGGNAPGDTVAYTTVLSNSGYNQRDNPGDEYTDVLPAGLTLVSATASSGTAVANAGTNTVTWNGAVANDVIVTTTATIDAGTEGRTLSNQGTIAFDADADGSNESTALTDDPAVAGATDPTGLSVVAAQVGAPVSSALPSAKLAVALGAATKVAGAKTHVTAKGLAAGERYTITLGSKKLVTGTASASGTVSTLVTIPKTLAGVKRVTVTGSTNDRTGTAGLRVLKRSKLLRVSHSPSPVVEANRDVTIVVKGLGPNEKITAIYNGHRASARNAKANRRGVYRVTVAAGWDWGLRTFTVTGAGAHRTGTDRIDVERRR